MFALCFAGNAFADTRSLLTEPEALFASSEAGYPEPPHDAHAELKASRGLDRAEFTALCSLVFADAAALHAICLHDLAVFVDDDT